MPVKSVHLGTVGAPAASGGWRLWSPAWLKQTYMDLDNSEVTLTSADGKTKHVSLRAHLLIVLLVQLVSVVAPLWLSFEFMKKDVAEIKKGLTAEQEFRLQAIERLRAMEVRIEILMERSRERNERNERNGKQ